MLAQLASVPISVILFVWMLRIKKDDPFPRGAVFKMLLTGALCVLGATILTMLAGFAAAAIRVGPDTIAALMANPTEEAAQSFAARLQELNGEPTVRSVLKDAFIVAALVEELLKYLAMRLCARKPGVIRTRMDAIVCAAIVALAFQVPEDFLYASGSVVTALSRAVMPFHFLFGVIMGYYYGLSLVTGKRSDRAKALLYPILVHGLFDFGVKSLTINDNFFILTILVLALTLALTVYVIVKLRRWSREGTLSEPISAAVS